jgi:LAO/AO transport system kinase
MIPREPAALLAEAKKGSRVALARLLTYVESGGALQAETASLAYRELAPFVVGITGPPGAGKSTLTDRLITKALERTAFGEAEALSQVGILCIDPSSPFTGGAILGDRIRMQEHATNPQVYIRSMATRGHLGGLSLAVPDALRVLGASEFPFVFVETVGVGQMEVDIAAAADTTVVVTNPGWGDAMQASKAGLLEVADIFVINKADRSGVRETIRDLEQMLDLGGERDWRPLIIETVAATNAGTDELWDALKEHRAYLATGDDEQRRRRRAKAILDKVIAASLDARVRNIAQGSHYAEQLDALMRGETDPYRAAEELLS